MVARFFKKNESSHQIKVDSYVLETNVHFPTDLNLAWDAARKTIELTSQLAMELSLPGWRKDKDWKTKIKSAMRTCARACKGGGANKQKRIIETATHYLGRLYALEEKLTTTLIELRRQALTPKQIFELRNITDFQDLLIATDQHHLIHSYKIMTGGNESAEVIPLADRLLNQLPSGELASISFDRGFSSVENRELLELEIPTVIMPKKGKLTQADRERQRGKKWRQLANAHSAVESNINALEHHGLDRCPDKGEKAYHRHVGLGVLSYNLHRIGGYLQEEQRQTQRNRAA